MELLVIILSFVFAQAGVIKETDCDGVVVNDVYHEKDILKTDIDRPYSLAVDYVTNKLYFSYTPKDDDESSKTAKIDLNNKKYEEIDLEGGFAQAVDAKTREVYIGTDKGVFKYDYNDGTIEETPIKENIWMVFFKDELYFSEFPSQFLYVYSNDEVKRFKDLEDTKVDSIVIDKDDNMFYTNGTGLYMQKRGTKKGTVLIKEIENIGVRGMTIDVNNEVYVCMADGIYKVNKVNENEMQLDKYIDIDDAFGVAFDNRNNLVYSDATELVRLKPNKSKDCEVKNTV